MGFKITEENITHHKLYPSQGKNSGKKQNIYQDENCLYRNIE